MPLSFHSKLHNIEESWPCDIQYINRNTGSTIPDVLMNVHCRSNGYWLDIFIVTHRKGISSNYKLSWKLKRRKCCILTSAVVLWAYILCRSVLASSQWLSSSFWFYFCNNIVLTVSNFCISQNWTKANCYIWVSIVFLQQLRLAGIVLPSFIIKSVLHSMAKIWCWLCFI